MIEHLRIQHFGCIKDAELHLSPLHAFIGPNNSGKSTILRAVRTLMQLALGTFGNPEGAPTPFDPGVDPASPYKLAATFQQSSLGYSLFGENGALFEQIARDGNVIESSGSRSWNRVGLLAQPRAAAEARQVRTMLAGGARLVRFDPDALRAPSTLIPESDRVRLQDERGLGLPAVYDTILNRGDDTFHRIVREVRRLFPAVKALRLKVTSASTKALEIELTSGVRVPATTMGEGLLYYLAFAAIPYLEPTSVLLVEEPENGLHPARIGDIMQILREISHTTQVLIATHSPLVINEMQGHEVSVTTWSEGEGSKVRLLSETPNFTDRSKVYALGELWISYANGDDERPLFTEPLAIDDSAEQVDWQADEDEGEDKGDSP